MRSLVVSVLSLLAAAPAAHAVTISYPDFSSTAGLQLNGSAAQAGDVLRLTPATFNQAGSAFSTDAVSLDANASFSTFFSFNINGSGGLGGGADGIVFIVQTVSNTAGGGGGGIGYSGINNSLGVEFDTFDNGPSLADPNANHIGIDLEGNIASVVTATPSFAIETGATRFAWIDYNGASDLLEVRLSESNARPVSALLSHTVDLVSVLGVTNAFVGFSAGTGAGFANHDILSWEFRSTFDPIGTPVPEPAALGLLGLGVLGLAARRRRAERAR